MLLAAALPSLPPVEAASVLPLALDVVGILSAAEDFAGADVEGGSCGIYLITS